LRADFVGNECRRYTYNNGRLTTDTNRGHEPRREKKELGKKGEEKALRFLKKKGYRILGTNYFCREGEIDIVARQGEYLAFIEVRTKSDLEFGTPEESITPAKMRRLQKAAYHYLYHQDKTPDLWRIDVVVVELDGHQKPKRIELIENAVEE